MGVESIVRTALYLRLSREDERNGISESIHSQKMLLTAYAKQHHFHITAVYTDDGISGVSQERPAFQSLLQAIRLGYVQILLVKDLSRLSRDYIKTGELLEHFFPMYHVRFISVCDGLDTARKSSANDYLPIRAVMDDFYARDVSKKVRAAIYARQQHGICTAARLPYGYEKKAENIQIHETNSKTVDTIFSLYLSGNSMCHIARMLSEQKIGTPSENGTRWNDVSVRKILTNPAYCGTLMLHTTEKISNKSKLQKRLPKESWLPIPIPRIITQETFANVQKLMKEKKHNKQQKHPLTEKIFCIECGSPMTISSQNRVYCRKRKRYGICQNPSLLLDELIEVINEQLDKDKISAYQHLLPFLIDQIQIGKEQTEIFLNYQMQ